MNNNIKVKDLFNCDISFLKSYFDEVTYPWELLPKIKDIIATYLKKGIKGYKLYKKDILIGKNVSIAKTATILPPAIIGNDVTIRPGAFIRGNVIIGDKSVIGNSTELKNAILLNHVQVPHYNYVGDSILGNNSHMGAGSICSNFKNDGKNIIIKANKKYETNLRKVGSFIGENVQVGCGSVLNPGTIIGKNTMIYPLSMLRGIYPSNAIIKNKVKNEIIIQKKK